MSRWDYSYKHREHEKHFMAHFLRICIRLVEFDILFHLFVHYAMSGFFLALSETRSLLVKDPRSTTVQNFCRLGCSSILPRCLLKPLLAAIQFEAKRLSS
jgi:hypothetical protein